MPHRHPRRHFLGQAGLAAVGAALGSAVPFSRHFPSGLIPAAFAAGDSSAIAGKIQGLVVLGERPLTVETPAHLLDDAYTPADRMFVRNNGHPPATIDVASWTLTVEGEAVKTPATFTLAELKSKFKAHTYALTLECGGNGRAEFQPSARGNQWTTGAVSCAQWTGVRLRDVLKAAGADERAVYVGFVGRDTHLSQDPRKVAISRGVPIEKALRDETLIAWAMNGADIPMLHGHPLRLVAGGYPASASGKWLSKLLVRDRVHDGAKMGDKSYRVPCRPVQPGQRVADEEMCIIESMPVKSLITFPKSGVQVKAGDAVALRGHAWAGELDVKAVQVSTDFGQTWQPANLKPAKNRHAWQRFSASVTLGGPGYYEIWARATDTQGKSQPMVVPGWNEKGYLNNACHRIAVQAV